MMHAQLFPYFAFRFATHPTLVIIALSRFHPSLLPLMVDAAFLCKWPRVVIPMFSRVACIVPSQTFRYFQAHIFASFFAFMRRTVFQGTQLLGATPRASCSFVGVASFHIERLAAKSTRFLNLRAVTFPRAKAGMTACLRNREGFTAHFTDTFNLFQERQTPALTRTIGLRFLSRIGNEILLAGGTSLCIHSSIITQTVWQW